MYTIKERNVNHVLYKGVSHLVANGIEISPRGIKTLEYPEPVATVYEKPCERVLFYPERDANPFFHFMESLWILAGRDDVGFLKKFNSNIANYSDDGIKFHGAYGHRLRYKLGFDQIKAAIDLLKRDPDTRQAVLQIWSANDDLGAKTNDVPCNDLIFLKVRKNKLNITVCNRSNDIIWGAYGANVVQFSVLQEYLAAMIGVGVGVYTQVSDSYHVYPDNPKFNTILSKSWKCVDDPYLYIKPYDMVSKSYKFDEDLERFFDGWFTGYSNPFFEDVAVPMLVAWETHKTHKTGSFAAKDIKAADWRLACLEWLERRGDTLPTDEWGFDEGFIEWREKCASTIH